MAFDPAQWLHHFVLPLVAGGDVRVATAVGARELAALRTAALDRDASVERIAEARHAVVAELLLGAREPELDDEALRLAGAMQNLLFLAHPGTAKATVTRRRMRAVSAFAAQLATLPLPDADDEGARVVCERHSMLHHLFDLGRDDVRVSFWVGKREFRGSEPPSRLLKWPDLRRVREERWRVTIVSEAMADPLMRPIVTALLAASPLTDLLEPTRLEPRFDLLPVARWLKEPAIARAVADRWLGRGLPQIADALVKALLALYNDKDARARAAARTATAFACHLQLLALAGRRPLDEREHLVELQGQVQLQPGMRDFCGLFAAAQRVGLGRPADVARDPRLRAEVDAYAAACLALVGAERLHELVGVMGRGVGQMLLTAG